MTLKKNYKLSYSVFQGDDKMNKQNIPEGWNNPMVTLPPEGEEVTLLNKEQQFLIGKVQMKHKNCYQWEATITNAEGTEAVSIYPSDIVAWKSVENLD